MPEAIDQPKLFSRLNLGRLRCQAFLGWEERERRNPQWVSLEIEVRFPELPEACRSDELGGAVCYATVSSAIREICARRVHRLVESLAYEIFAGVRRMIPPSAGLRISVTKERPPIPDLEGGAAFTIEDSPCG